MNGRKFDPRQPEYGDPVIAGAPQARTATLPSIFGVTRASLPGGASPANVGQRFRVNRALSTPGASPFLYHFERLDPSQQGQTQMPPPPFQRQLSEGSEFTAISSVVDGNWTPTMTEEGESNSDKVKLKLMSIWNNVKYGE